MTAPSGAFYSATDADSDGAEGTFFVWSEAEIRAVLGGGPATERFIRFYGVTPAGNFDGRNILFVPRADEKERAALAGARAKLYAARARRIPPAARRQDPRGLERPHDLGAGAGRPRARRAALHRRRRAGGGLRSRQDAPGRRARAQLRGRSRRRSRLPRGSRVSRRRPVRPLRRWVRSPLAARGARALRGDGDAVRGSGRGRLVRHRREARDAARAREADARRRHAFGDVGGDPERPAGRHLHRRRPLARDRRPRASARWARRWPDVRSR